MHEHDHKAHMKQPLLVLENLSKYYVNGKNVVAGLNKVNLNFCQGEFVAITGESGSGKSTLGHVLGGILSYEDGELLVEGTPTSHYDSADWERYRRDNIAFISQNYGILPGATVMDNVVSALRLTGMEKQDAYIQSQSILRQVELWPMRHRRAARLSSGQKQRLAIARALAKPCPILIADEPTGNLDPENSQKVIELLAKAAQERLVVLITHEYSECESYVTRHISLQDGVISGDAQIRPAAKPKQAAPARKRTRNLGLYSARLQLKSRPVWSTMVLLFFSLTAFAVFAFLGTFIVASDDTSTRIYESGAFANGDPRRIVAVRMDDQPMTDGDYETILALNHVEQLESYGYIADFCYAYVEGVDYTFHYSNHNYGSTIEPVYIETKNVEILTKDQFMQTVPVTNRKFLTAGRMPESFYEVVAVGSEELLDQVITVYIKDWARWARDAYIRMDVTVVGVTEQGSGLYFSDDVGAMLTIDLLGDVTTYMPASGEIYDSMEYINYFDAGTGNLFLLDQVPYENSQLRPMADDEIQIAFGLYSGYSQIYFTYNYFLMYESSFAPGYHVAGVHDSTYQGLYVVSENAFRQYLAEHLTARGNQVSITITDYAYTDRVLESLEEAGYYAVSPYVLGSTKVDSELADQRMQTLMICLLALLAVVALQFLLIRALFGMQTDSYRILSNIGLIWPGARASVLLQVLFFTIVGQTVGFGAICVLNNQGVEQIVNLTKYLDGAYWIVLAAVHLVSTQFAAAGVLGNLKKQVYPLSTRRVDLAPRKHSKEAAV